MTIKAGPHVAGANRNGLGLVLDATPALVVSIGDGDVLQEAKDRGGENVTTVFRHWAPEKNYADYPADMSKWPDEAFARVAAEYWWAEVLWPSYKNVRADFYQPINEAAGDDQHSIRMMVAFEIRLMELAEEAGIKLAVASLSYDSPVWSLWQEYYIPLLRRAAEGGHAYSRHAYGGDSAPLRVIAESEYLKQEGISVPILVTEAGVAEGASFPGTETVMEKVRSYDKAFAPYDNIIGFAFWTYGDWGYDGGNANIASASEELAAYIRDNGGAAPFAYPSYENEGSTSWYNRLTGAADEFSTDNPDAALRKFILSRGMWPYGKETWVEIGGKTYAVQKAIDWQSSVRPLPYMYAYAEVGDWGNVQWASEKVSDASPFGFKVWPVAGVKRHINQRFGANPQAYLQFGLPGHEGLDFYAPWRSKVLAVNDGKVKAVLSGGNYGINVRLEHGDGWETVYAHLSEPAVRLGEEVTAGQVIGYANSTGNSTGHHLHMTVKHRGFGEPGYGGDIVDPTPFIIKFQPTWEGSQNRTYDLLDYIRGDGRAYELAYNWGDGGTHPIQTQVHDGRFYTVKGGGQFEELWATSESIMRGMDTSEDWDKFYVFYTPTGYGLSYGAQWAPRFMTIGQSAPMEPYIKHYWKSNCQVRLEGHPKWTIQLNAHYSSYTFPSGITLGDVIEIEWRENEVYFFARGYGLVMWDGSRSVFGGKSWINKELPGQTLAMNRPGCL